MPYRGENVVEAVISHVTACITMQNWQALDDELARMDVAEIPDLGLVAWCRSTHPIRSVLPSRVAFIQACYEEISQRHSEETAGKWFKGLLTSV